MNISYLLIYIKGINETEKKLSENVAKGEKKKSKKKWTYVLIITQINQLLVRSHLHKNEVDLGSLEHIERTPLRQKLQRVP